LPNATHCAVAPTRSFAIAIFLERLHYILEVQKGRPNPSRRPSANTAGTGIPLAKDVKCDNYQVDGGRQLLWEGTVHSFAKRIFGVGVIVMLGLSAVQTGLAAQVVLSDPLTSWPLNFGAQTANVMLKDGAVHIVESGSAGNWETFSGFSFTDMDASVTISAQTATGSAAGLLFWATGPSDFFYFGVADVAGTFSIYRYVSANGGAWQAIFPFTANAAVKTGVGAVNTLRLVTKGNSAALFVNGQSLGTLDLQAPSAGGTVGIYAEGQAGQPADYVFSNLSVSQ
jgi:hypothetical protein